MVRLSPVTRTTVFLLGLLAAATASADDTNSNQGSNGIGQSPSSSLASTNQLITVDGPSGSASATLPIDLPTARGGVQPHLSLNYLSDSGDGEAGAGWHLSLPSIERRGPSGGPQPTYQDQSTSQPGNVWDQYDRFVYNGRPLVPICSLRSVRCANAPNETMPTLPASALGQWAYYRLEVDDGSAMRFFLSPDNLTWVVQVPHSNETLEFGQPLAQAGIGEPVDMGDAGHVFRWHLSRQYDNQRSSGVPTNPIVYLWANGILTDIFDTPPVADSPTSFNPNDFAHHVHVWTYNTERYPSKAPIWRRVPDQVISHIDVSSADIALSQRIGVRSTTPNARSLVRRYNLVYTNNPIAHVVNNTVYGYGDHRITLYSVQLEGRCPSGPIVEAPLPSNPSLNALPDADPGCTTMQPTTMTYSTVDETVPPVPFVLPNSHGAVMYWHPGHAFWETIPSVVADMNQDGFADILTPPWDISSDTLMIEPNPSIMTQQLNLNVGGRALNPVSMGFPASISGMFRVTTTVAPGLAFGGNWGGNGKVSVLWRGEAPFARDQRRNESLYSKDDPSVWPSALFSASVGTASTTQPGNWNQIGTVSPGWNLRYQDTAGAQIELLGPTLDINGDGLEDGYVEETYWEGNVQDTGPEDYIGDGVFFTTQDRSGGLHYLYGDAPTAPNPALNIAPNGNNRKGSIVGLTAVSASSPMRDAHNWVANQLAAQGNNPVLQHPFPNEAWHWADMDGDGLVDVVVTQNSTVTYWRGNGLGWFGDGTCAPGAGGAPVCAYGPNSQGFVMAGAPTLGGTPDFENIFYFHDLNGDGLADYVITSQTGISVLFNEAGTAFVNNVHLSPDQVPGWTDSFFGFPRLLAFADMNGSGVDDLIFLGPDVVFWDFAKGIVPGKLRTITNGLGGSETITYASSASLFLDKAPIVQNKVVVTSVTVDNGLAAGAPNKVTQTKTYSYDQPAFDVRTREFRGFQQVRVDTAPIPAPPGDLLRAPIPGTSVVTNYLIGTTPTGPSLLTSVTGIDDVNAVLHGLPVFEEVSDDTRSVYVSSSHTQYEARQTYAGEDGRVVRLVYPHQTDTMLYDPAGAFTPGGVATSFVDVTTSDTRLGTHSGSYPVRATAGAQLVRKEVHLDDHGNADLTTDYGRVQNGWGVNTLGPADVPVMTQSGFSAPVGSDPGAWLWRPNTVTTFTGTAASPTFSRTKSLYYDAVGNPNGVISNLTGTLPLGYHHEVPGAGVAPQPPGKAVEGNLAEFAATSIDPYGNVVSFVTANGQQCTSVVYDAVFKLVPTQTTVGCGTPSFTTSLLGYDLGIEKATSVSGVHNDVSAFTYDDFGRLKEAFEPDPTVPGMPSLADSVLIQYTEDSGAHVFRTHAYRHTGEVWQITDALGSTLATFQTADRSNGDTSDWIASDITERASNGVVRVAHPPFFWSGAAPGSVPGEALIASNLGSIVTHDAFGRVVSVTETDGHTVKQQTAFHALSSVISDAEDLLPGGPHYGTPTTVQQDGFGRTIAVTTTSATTSPGQAPQVDQVTTTNSYLPTGELTQVLRTHTADSARFVRTVSYDSLGRMVSTTEPNSTLPGLSLGPHSVLGATWTYAYDYAGNLVGMSDARGCGKNIYYDGLGRPLAYDFSPCLAAQATYTPPVTSGSSLTGDGTEGFFVYDASETGATDSPAQTAAAVGRLTAVYDQAAHTQLAYDPRGNVVQMNRQIATPTGSSALAWRYSETSFSKSIAYDPLMDRVTAETTGAQAPALLVNGSSRLSYGYSLRGLLATVNSDYGTLVGVTAHDAAGRRTRTTYGDVAQTTQTAHYNDAGWLDTLKVNRSGSWAQQTARYTPPSLSAGPTTLQKDLLDDSFVFDGIANPTQITDNRPPAEWGPGAQPATRTFTYDDNYRVTEAKYASGADTFSPPLGGLVHAMPMLRPAKRVQKQDVTYDWLGNTSFSSTDDDANGFFDRSLGQITNGGGSFVGPNQIQGATGPGGNLSANYDAAGNLVSLLVTRTTGTCTDPAGKCTFLLVYSWDEVGRLSSAQRWGYAGAYTGPSYPDVPSSATADATLRYTYDAEGNRVSKALVLPPPPCGRVCRPGPPTTYALSVFDTLRLDGSQWTPSVNAYEDSEQTETVYLPAADARVLVDTTGTMPALAAGNDLHVFFEPSDHLGSTAAIFDKDTSELVERDTYQAYGSAETDYQPARWSGFHERYRFTGKEDDAEVGLTYFGARYYSPNLGRWISPDPLTIHALGADLNPYAYVTGHATSKIDPFGLDDLAPDGAIRVVEGNHTWVQSGFNNWELDPQQGTSGDTGTDPNQIKNAPCRSMTCHTEVNPDPWKVSPPPTPRERGERLGDLLGLPFRPFFGPENTANALNTGEHGIRSTTKKDLAITVGVTVATGVAGKVVAGVVGGLAAEAVAPYEVGTYENLVARSPVGDDLALHHVGQAHAMEQVVPGYERATGPSIALPTGEHRLIPNLRGTVDLTPRQLLARDIWNLRTYTNTPNSALSKLIQMNKDMYPEAFAP